MYKPTTQDTTPNGAVFLDRDGTIIREVGYLSRLDEIELLPGAAEAILKLNCQRIPVILITNQSGVARGKITEEFVKQSHLLLNRLLARKNAHIDDFFYCPHHPEVGNAQYRKICTCRKPAPGLLLQAAGKHSFDLERSFVIGDKLIDVKMAQEVNARGILVKTGYGNDELKLTETSGVSPDQVCSDISEAVDWILKIREDNF